MTGRTGEKTFNNHNYCTSCEYFRMNVQPDGRWLETCVVTGEELIWIYGQLKKSDHCPFKEVKNV